MRIYHPDGNHVDTPDPQPDPMSAPEDDTRADLAEYLTNLAAFARRQMYVVERFSDDPPTAWTKAHRRIDEALYRWQLAQ